MEIRENGTGRGDQTGQQIKRNVEALQRATVLEVGRDRAREKVPGEVEVGGCIGGGSFEEKAMMESFGKEGSFGLLIFMDLGSGGDDPFGLR
ncbi:hypothetical protein EV2_003855 [Malus domestica]